MMLPSASLTAIHYCQFQTMMTDADDTYGNWMDEFFVQRSVWGDRVWGALRAPGVLIFTVFDALPRARH